MQYNITVKWFFFLLRKITLRSNAKQTRKMMMHFLPVSFILLFLQMNGKKTSTDFARFPFRFCIVVSLMSACLILVCYLSKSFFSFQFEIINALLLHLLENHLARDFVQWFTYTSQVKIAHLMLKF